MNEKTDILKKHKNGWIGKLTEDLAKEEDEEVKQKKQDKLDELLLEDDEEVEKPKRERTQKQKDSLKRAMETKMANAQRRKEEKEKEEEAKKEELQKKIIAKAIAIKRAQIKKEKIIDEIPDEVPLKKTEKPKVVPKPTLPKYTYI